MPGGVVDEHGSFLLHNPAAKELLGIRLDNDDPDAWQEHYGLFRPDTPGPLILAMLLAGGFFRSLQFTGINTLTMSDVPQPRMSHASSFSSIAQQLSLSVGVGIGAMVLHFTIAYSGSAAIVGLRTANSAPVRFDWRQRRSLRRSS